jgi:hypothetical protein
MARSALPLLRGAREVSFSFQDEPGEHRWTLSRGEADSLRLRIFWSKDTFNHRFPGPRAPELSVPPNENRPPNAKRFRNLCTGL